MEGISESRKAIQQAFDEKGFHVADVGGKGNLRMVRRSNGDRIVLFSKNLNDDEQPEYFFPENWQRSRTKFDSTRAVGQVQVRRQYKPEGSDPRSYMIKTVSPFRPFRTRPENKHVGDTAFSEARILLDLQEHGFSPEVPVAVVMRPGYLPTLVTRFIKGSRMASWKEASDLQVRLKEAGYHPHDLFRLDAQRLMALHIKEPNVNAVTVKSEGITHPVDVEFYDVPGYVAQTRRKKKKGDYPTREPITKQEKLRRLSGPSVSRPLSGYDFHLRRWKPSEFSVPFSVELRAFVPGKKTKKGKEPGQWVPLEEAPDAPWRRFVVFEPYTQRWVLPEHASVQVPDGNGRFQLKPAFEMADGRLHAFVAVDERTGFVHEAKSLVREIFDG